MKIATVLHHLEKLAPPALQEPYDNAGLLTGDDQWECTGILIALDSTEAVVAEAIGKKCNLIIAHHPIIFKGLKKLNGKNYVERTIISALKTDVAIYAIHTNLDNVVGGVNGKIAGLLGLNNCRILKPLDDVLKKLVTFAPVNQADGIRNALFYAGAGNLGRYSECSFNSEGTGTFKAEAGAAPYVGEIGKRHEEKEMKIEVIFPGYLQDKIVKAMINAHPYQEVAYDLFSLNNHFSGMGSGLVGELAEAMDEMTLLQKIKDVFKLSVIKHTALCGNKIKTAAVCGGAGSFLIPAAMASQAGIYITSDVKYHEFFEADNRILIADIGHYESEKFTTDLLYDYIKQIFTNFAVQKTDINTNPVQYFI